MLLRNTSKHYYFNKKTAASELFSSTEASVSDIEEELGNLKASIKICFEILLKLFNDTKLTFDFPEKVKVADVSPIF